MMFLRTPHHRAWAFGNQDGKGTIGCFLSLILLAAAGFVALRVGPDWFSYKNLETDVKTEVSRAGANLYDDESVVKGILIVARKNEIKITKDNVKVERFGNQLKVVVTYSVPVDVVVYQTRIDYQILASSYIGNLR